MPGDGHSRLVLVGTLGPGEVLGWSCLRDEPVSLATARATGTVRLVAIPAESLLALLALLARLGIRPSCRRSPIMAPSPCARTSSATGDTGSVVRRMRR